MCLDKSMEQQQAPIRGRRKKAAKKRPVIVPIHSEDKKGLDKHPPQDQRADVGAQGATWRGF